MSVCAECGREIKWFGRLRGARYCSDEHRLRALAHARVQGATATVREREPSEQSAAETALSALARSGPEANGRNRYTLVFAGALTVAVAIGVAGLPSWETLAFSGKIVENEMRRRAAVRLYDDFQSGLNAWTPAITSTGHGRWAIDHGFLRPGALRLWSEAGRLADYQFEFAGQIGQKALNWAFRATDQANYYGCRLEITRPGPLPVVDFVRFVRNDGRVTGRMRSPLPMTVRADTVYDVRMQIRGTDFVAIVNGQIVDAWSDATHTKGSVGFWSESGEQASIRYARLTERDDFTGRVLADMLEPAGKE